MNSLVSNAERFLTAMRSIVSQGSTLNDRVRRINEIVERVRGNEAKYFAAEPSNNEIIAIATKL